MLLKNIYVLDECVARKAFLNDILLNAYQVTTLIIFTPLFESYFKNDVSNINIWLGVNAIHTYVTV